MSIYLRFREIYIRLREKNVSRKRAKHSTVPKISSGRLQEQGVWGVFGYVA